MSTIRNVAIVTTLTACVACFAQDKKIERSQLPAPVEKSLQTQLNATPGATVRGYATEIEGGQRLYEAELTVDGHGKDISFRSNGDVAEIEEEIPMNSLPADVKTALEAKAKARSATIEKVESLTKKDKLVAYEATARTATGRHAELQVGPQGQTLKHEE